MSTSPSSRQESQPRYWCYTCNAEVQIYMAPDLTCQQCNEQFIEEIDSENDPQSFLAGADDNQGAGGDRGAEGLSNTTFFRYETGDDDDIFHIYAPMGGRNEGGEEAGNPNQPLAAMLQNLLSSMLGPAGMPPPPPGAQSPGAQPTSPDANEGEGEAGSQQQQRRQPYLFYGSMLDGNVQFRPMNMPSQPNGEGGDMRAEFTFEMHNNRSTEEQEEGRGDGNRPPNLTASLMQILSAIAGGGPLGEGFVGNPDDYVFSQTALDNIISQLMEQTSGRNAPPPAPEAVIDSLPKRKLTDQEIAQQTDCAVCKDEFDATEQVIELPCAHVFHDECIKPWLKVNGTCPVCRHGVVDEQDQSGHDDNNASSSQQPDDLPRRPSNGNSQQAPPPSSSSSPAQGNQAPDTTSTLSSLLFEGARQMYNSTSRSPSSGWHSSIPGPFTWGPGGRTTNNPTSSSNNNTNNNNNNNNNNNSNSNGNNNDNTQQQRSNDSNNNDMMDLDLD